jgi:hypothetical protein
MQATDNLTPLGHKILKHWRKYRPTMVATLSERNQLQQAIAAPSPLITISKSAGGIAR